MFQRDIEFGYKNITNFVINLRLSVDCFKSNGSHVASHKSLFWLKLLHAPSYKMEMN